MVPASFSPPQPDSPDCAALEFAGQEFVLSRCGGLYWPEERALLVSDLHLEKGSYFARFGQMLPPYDSRETLERMAALVSRFDVRRVITLGDNFHDDAGAMRLESKAATLLYQLTGALDWLWITGNHDENLPRTFGADIAEEGELGGIILRHEAKPGECRAELSGHFHPKIRVKLRGRHITRPCAVIARGGNSGTAESEPTADRMIMPAYGAYTGGMDAHAPEVASALSPALHLDAVVVAKGKALHLPIAPRPNSGRKERAA